MFENRNERTSEARGAEEPKTTRLRNQLLAWCKHIATEAAKALAWGNRSVPVERFLLEALEAASRASSANARELTRLILKADLVFQLAEYLGAEQEPEYQESLENQLREQELAAAEPDDATIDELAAQGEEYDATAELDRLGATAFGLRETIVDGLKGVATLLRRATELGERTLPRREFEGQGIRARVKETRARDAKEKEAKAALVAEAERIEAEVATWRENERSVVDGVVETLALLAAESTDVDALFGAVETTGRLAALALGLVETGTFLEYGTPSPTVVRASAAPGKCVLFSGDDFDVLLELLERAEVRELNVWTRGEAVAAHSFPAFKKFKRLAGHYGGSWLGQQREFGAFPGAILVASTPLETPDESYRDYIFASGATRADGVASLERDGAGKLDFSALIRAAVDSPGFADSRGKTAVEKIAVGFGGDGLDGMIDKLARAFRQDRTKRVFVVGGEDAPDGSDYFASLFDAIPAESTVVSFGDAKFRFNRKPAAPTAFGTPKTLDLGRVCDAGAVFRFAEKLGAELDREPAVSPVAFFFSRFDETSTAAFLAAVGLGYRRVFVGPSSTAAWSPELAALFAERLGVRVVDEPAADVAAALN
ncbi:MAG: hypothetical protein IKU86_11045 [Thermoguttaceae bacterium]|nr:hypothetical protein [Thermoguttaceae bacterium]